MAIALLVTSLAFVALSTGRFQKQPRYELPPWSDKLSAKDDLHDPCYSQYRQSVKCVPAFTDAAASSPVQASSTCGIPPQTFCQHSNSEPRCKICDAAQPHLAHPEFYVTDLHNANNATCWWSKPFEPSRPENVSLVVSLGKRFDLVYINVEFCMKRPDSMVLLKSADFGHTWQPFQYYSSDCENVYGRPAKNVVSPLNEQEPLCLNPDATTDGGFIGNSRIVFSTLEKRPSSRDFDTSAVLQDWVTVSDIKVIFTRPFGSLSNHIRLSQRSTRVGSRSNEVTYFYGVSNLVVGGRCKCNGHASRCIRHKTENRLVCDCRHNTAGDDCERCKPFHLDRPWARATSESANECIACNCNLHARKCRFDRELYLLSERRSGGVCKNCRHNTAGRYCHYCKDGFFRDYTKPIIHRKACKPCRCHPVGSLGKACNQTSGQCPCKDGVTGLTCNRCANGFHQSESSTQPCVKTASKDSLKSPYDLSKPEECSKRKCRANSRRISESIYCNFDYALQIEVIEEKKDTFVIDSKSRAFRSTVPDTINPLNGASTGSTTSGDFVKYQVNIVNVFKRSKFLPAKRGPAILSVHRSDHECRCPRIKLGQRYLILSRDSRSGLKVGRNSIVIRWREDWLRRIRRLQRVGRKGQC